MTNLLKESKFALAILSLLIGFVGGVVFTVYNAPTLTSQLATEDTQEAEPKIDWAEHISHLKESLEKDPKNTEMVAQLANAYYETQDYQQSIDTYLQLVTMVDEKSTVYQDLGVVYRKDGQFEKSVEAFENAIAQDPTNLHALFNIGIVQFHDLNDQAGAKKTWEKIAAVKPDFQLPSGMTIQQVIEKL